MHKIHPFLEENSQVIKITSSLVFFNFSFSSDEGCLSFRSGECFSSVVTGYYVPNLICTKTTKLFLFDDELDRSFQ